MTPQGVFENSSRWIVIWHPAGKPDAVGRVSIGANSAEKARDIFELHNPNAVIVGDPRVAE